jgi:hypothetical protein
VAKFALISKFYFRFLLELGLAVAGMAKIVGFLEC